MARQFREQLEEEVQLEAARKAQHAATPPPVEPEPAAAERPREGAGSTAPPHAPANGGGNELTPDISDTHHAQPGGADERRT